MFNSFFDEVVVPLLIATIVLVTASAAVVGGFIVVKAYRQAAPEPTRISLDAGGRLGEYIENYSAGRVANTRYIIDGLCISACTLILGEIPRENVCVTKYAKLAFHAAFSTDPIGGREFSPEGSGILWVIYPEWTRQWLKRHGWEGPDKDQPTLIWMEERDLLEVYNECK